MESLAKSSVFFRLRRTPNPLLDQQIPEIDEDFLAPIVLRPLGGNDVGGSIPLIILTMGTVGSQLGLQCADDFAQGAKVVAIPAVQRFQIPKADQWKSIFEDMPSPCHVLTIEDDIGALATEVANAVFRAGVANKIGKMTHKTVEQVGPSCRTFEASATFHGFTVASIRRTL